MNVVMIFDRAFDSKRREDHCIGISAGYSIGSCWLMTLGPKWSRSASGSTPEVVSCSDFAHHFLRLTLQVP